MVEGGSHECLGAYVCGSILIVLVLPGKHMNHVIFAVVMIAPEVASAVVEMQLLLCRMHVTMKMQAPRQTGPARAGGHDIA